MFRIDKDNCLSLTRGDTAYLYVEFDGYTPQEGDTITMTICDDEATVVSKTITYDYCFVIEPQDTEALDCGRYYYDIQLDTVYGEVFTVVEKSNFYLKEELSK